MRGLFWLGVSYRNTYLPGPIMDPLLNGLNDFFRYSADTVENLLGQLQHPDHSQTRWGGPEADHTFRGVLADALDEADRPTEASLLRQPKQHVVLHEGQVRPGRFHMTPLHASYQQLRRQATQMTGEENFPWRIYVNARDRWEVANLDSEEAELYHPQEARNRLVHTVLSGVGLNPDGEWAEGRESNEANPDWAELRKRALAVRDAPIEEVDHTHPTERK